MADNSRGAAPNDDAHIDFRPLLRLGAWGAGALAAVAAVIAVAQSDVAERRAGTAVASLSGAPNPQTLRTNGAELLARAETEREARRLADAVRTLAADRDRLATRVTELERHLDDLTGSVARVAAQAQRPPADTARAAPPEPPPVATPPQTAPVTPAPPKPVAAVPPANPAPAPPTASPAPPAPSATFQPPAALPAATPMWGEQTALPVIPPKDPETIPLPRPGPVAMLQSYAGAGASAKVASAPAAAQPARPDYAIDLGGATNLATLRGLWDRVRGRHAAVLDGLRPLVSIRDGARPGSTELRLVVGPLADSAAVARVCATLIPAGVSCQPAVFDGQRLAQR